MTKELLGKVWIKNNNKLSENEYFRNTFTNVQEKGWKDGQQISSARRAIQLNVEQKFTGNISDLIVEQSELELLNYFLH